MRSQREVKRKYDKLMHDVRTSDYYKGSADHKINCYRCDLGHITKTISNDVGVIPMYLDCETCARTATSTFYKDIAPGQEPTVEWYRPELKEMMGMRSKNEALLDHVLMGGLVKREIEKDFSGFRITKGEL